MRTYMIFFISLILTVNSSFAQTNDSAMIKRIADEIMVNSQAYTNLEYLCKQIGPRLSGSVNAAKAVTAAVKMLHDAGADTVYVQPCMVPHWVRGKKETGYIKLGDGTKYLLHLCALGNSIGTGKDGLLAKVIEIKSFAQLDRLREEGIKGKMVFFNFPMNPTYIETFRAYGESGVSRTRGPARAAKYGALGVMVRSLASNIDDYPHTGVTVYNDSFPKIPAVAISTSDAEWLSVQLKNGKEVEGHFMTGCKMLADEPSFNVIGEIRGSENPEEIITVGGHLDSWDLAEGAQDDGTGCVQSIEIIRSLKALKIQPRRTIRAVLFMNEENGGRGSQAYLANAKQFKEKHIFALESDAGGFTPRGFGIEMKEAQFNKVMTWKNLFADYGVYNFFRGGGGSDIGPLKDLGTALAGLSTDSQRYFDLHHAANDRLEAVSKRELNLGTVNMAAFVWLVSEHGL